MKSLKVSDNQWNSNLLFLYDETCIYGRKPEDALIAEKFSKPLRVPAEKWPSFFKRSCDAAYQ